MHKLAFKKPVIGGVIGCETEKITQFREGLPDDWFVCEALAHIVRSETAATADESTRFLRD